MSLKLVPCTKFMKMYSVPAVLFGVGEYPYTSGKGSPKERSKATVATSLATAKYLGIVIGVRDTRIHSEATAHGDEEGTV
jgi:hypothetical protein